ncbi:MAG: beta-glucosidase family protein [Pontibacterium sp.]
MKNTHSPETLVDLMTLEEQVSLLSGEDFWSLPAIPRLGINKLRVTDGPNGARGAGSLVGGVTAAAFPCGIALGATWNPDLIEEVGQAIAQEVKSKGAHVSLAPTVNIQRTATNGRNFECFSEDPELSAALSVSYIQGQKKENVASTIKHFAGNESEIERTTISSDVDERTLREIYLRPFEAAVKEAKTWGVMSSYNKLNGTYAAENHWLLTQVLREEWGFDGMVVSDWFGTRTTAPTVNAGCDLEMPGPTRDRGAKLIAAVEAGEVSAETVRERALNVLRLMERVGSINDDTPWKEIADDRPEHRDIIRRAGAEGTVLLKNEQGLLPLNKDELSSVAVIGPNAKVAQIMGGGSAQLNPHYTVTPWQGLASQLGEERLSFAEGCSNYRWEPLMLGDFHIDFYENRTLSGTPVHSEVQNDGIAFWIPPFGGEKVSPSYFSAMIKGEYTAEASGQHNLGFHSAGFAKVYLDDELVLDLSEAHWKKGRTFFEEGCDEVVAQVELEQGRTYQVRIEFISRQADNLFVAAWRLGISKPLGNEAIAAAAMAAAQAEVAVVFAGRSGEWDTEGSDLEHIQLPGRQDELIAAVLEANPNTVVVLQSGGPVEMPWVEQASTVLQSWYPGQECGNAIADVLFGDQEPSGRLPQTFPVKWAENPTYTDEPLNYPGKDGHVRYAEKLDIGYRHYDKTGIEPLFAFGHGLGYTEFSINSVQVAAIENNSATLTVELTNTGTRAGTSVVQVYVSEQSPTVERPVKELKAFQKVALGQGESTQVTLKLDARAFAYCDTQAKGWRINKGGFDVAVGFSATDLRETVTVQQSAALLPY